MSTAHSAFVEDRHRKLHQRKWSRAHAQPEVASPEMTSPEPEIKGRTFPAFFPRIPRYFSSGTPLDYRYEQFNFESNQSYPFWYLNPTNRTPSCLEFKSNQSSAFRYLNLTNGKPSFERPIVNLPLYVHLFVKIIFNPAFILTGRVYLVENLNLNKGKHLNPTIIF